MKTERRHELQTNELAIWLTSWLEAIKPYSKVLLGALVLLAAVWFAAAYVRSRGRESESRAWTALFQAYTPSAASDVSEQMADVAKSYPGTPAGLWALQTAADVHLAEGSQQLFRDREQAKQDLQQAQETYDTIAQQATDPMLKQRAMFGAAQCWNAWATSTKPRKNTANCPTASRTPPSANWPVSDSNPCKSPRPATGTVGSPNRSRWPAPCRTRACSMNSPNCLKRRISTCPSPAS